MIRVGFNAYLLASPQIRGWTRYTINLLAALSAHGVRPLLYSLAPVHETLLRLLPAGSYELRESGPMNYFRWEQSWLPRQCRRDRVDVLHALCNYGLPWSSHCPRVLTLHDAIDPIYYAPKRPWQENWKPIALKSRLMHWISRTRAHRVLTPSEHAAADLVRVLKVPRSRIRVTPEAADPGFHEPVTRERLDETARRWKLPPRYVFYVGGLEQRKNVPFLVKAFAAAACGDAGLVLAGGNEAHRDDLLSLARSLGIADRLHLLGYVPDEDLPALYRGAHAFVYPSEYEGFGLQITEAMAVGTPVLAARASCLPEVVGDGGETFTLADTGELAALLRRVMSDDNFRTELRRRARVRSAAFSWDHTAALTFQAYRELLDRRARV